MKNFSKRLFFFTALFLTLHSLLMAQNRLDSLLPVRGICIAAPVPTNVDSFVTFINKELAPRRINLMVLRVDYHYQFKTHPELIDTLSLSYADVKKIVSACKKASIRIVPQVNLLGHQSWANKTGKLLTVYPQLDETPWVQMPEKYQWPNPEGLYCKSYCPLHPEVHKIVFDVVDEICDAFEATAFHAGMDEVFYIGEDKCPRCGGRDKAELFAGEVRKINDHLATKGRELLIWGDRLLDGKTTGLGMWEASMNNTYRAIDMIPKEVIICDWHYERPDKTAVLFAAKGFRVLTCPWRKPDVAVQQVKDMVAFRQHSTSHMKGRFLGVMETVWSSVSQFFDGYYGKQKTITTPTDNQRENTVNTPWNTLKAMYAEMEK
ncbi:MAG: family 20 glycosylhydrolase, partial [Flavisolibacter sp.]|nr:family 20 glycosylhydrolase [Flavisolibacter sp.]